MECLVVKYDSDDVFWYVEEIQDDYIYMTEVREDAKRFCLSEAEKFVLSQPDYYDIIDDI